MDPTFKKTGFFRRLLVIAALFALVFTACTKKIYVPVEKIREVSVHDTTVLHKTDTLVKIPEVSIADFIDLKDTLIMRASNSEARAWVDTSLSVLKGRLVQSGKVPVQIVERERVVYRDSLVYQDKPVPVEVPKPYVPWPWKAMSVVGLLALAWIALKLFVLK